MEGSSAPSSYKEDRNQSQSSLYTLIYIRKSHFLARLCEWIFSLPTQIFESTHQVL